VSWSSIWPGHRDNAVTRAPSNTSSDRQRETDRISTTSDGRGA
jgi:hypothetical protein